MTPDAPEPTGDEQEIDYHGESAKKLALQCIEDVAGDASRQPRHKHDWLNLLFDRGGEENQWIAWDQTADVWTRIPTEGDYGIPPEVPRACTNIFANKIKGIAAILNQSDPAQEWRPASDDDEDLATAEVAGDIIPVLLDEIGYPDLKAVINKAVTLIDKVAIVVHYDPDPKHGESLVQAFTCVACGKHSMPMDIEEAEDTCPHCGAPAESEDPATGEKIEGFEAAVDSLFNPIGVNYPVGKLCGEILTSFEFSLPPYAKSPHAEDNPYLVAHQRYTEAEFVATWGTDHDELLKKVRGGAGDRTSQQYADAMRSLTSPHRSGGNAGMIQGPLVQRVWHDPIDTEDYQFPDGLYIVMCGETILEAGPLPLHDDQGKAIKNVLTRTFERQVGTAAGKPPADDLVPLQRMRNLWETVLAMRGLRYAMPTTWVPTTVTIDTPTTGMPQSERFFRSHDGQKPFTEQVDAGSAAVYENIDRIDAKMDEISGLNAILQGDRPEGDPTLGEVQRLEDRAYGQFKTPLDELIRFEKNLSILLLRFARETFWAPRIAKIRGDNDQWEISQFTNADLAGHVDVYVNPISAWPKSQLMQQLRMQKAVELGILVPQGDPELQVKILSDWNLTHLKKSLDVDRKQIARELDAWKAAQSPADIIPPPPPPIINPMMHLHYKTQFLKTEEAELIKDANPPLWQAMVAHVQLLQTMVAPPPAPAGPDGNAVKDAVDSGAIKPAGAGAANVSSLVQQGILTPADHAVEQQQKTGPSIDELAAARVLTPATPATTPH